MSLSVPVVKGMAIEKWVNVTSGDGDALKVALAKHGPISVGIDAAHKSLSFYSNGVYYEPKCGNTTDALVRYVHLPKSLASNIRKIRSSKRLFCKVCKSTAFRCYQCFTLRFLWTKANW